MLHTKFCKMTVDLRCVVWDTPLARTCALAYQSIYMCSSYIEHVDLNIIYATCVLLSLKEIAPPMEEGGGGGGDIL